MFCSSVAAADCREEGALVLNKRDRVTQDLVHLRDRVSEKSFSLSSTISAAESQTKLFKELQWCHTAVLGEQGGCYAITSVSLLTTKL